jgi:hypothetical protein
MTPPDRQTFRVGGCRALSRNLLGRAFSAKIIRFL